MPEQEMQRLQNMLHDYASEMNLKRMLANGYSFQNAIGSGAYNNPLGLFGGVGNPLNSIANAASQAKYHKPSDYKVVERQGFRMAIRRDKRYEKWADNVLFLFDEQ